MMHGRCLVDMLMDEYDGFSLNPRDFACSVDQMIKLRPQLSIDFILLKPHYTTLVEAEQVCVMPTYPTDGLVTLGLGNTTAR